jgi:glycosyltransferase involved in cell wall biosynthesis
MNILFVHQNFPGQYKNLYAALVAEGHRCEVIASSAAPKYPSASISRYTIHPTELLRGLHPWATDLHRKSFRAEAVASLAALLLDRGFRPDLVIGHPGWGELLAIKDVMTGIPVLHQLEFVYQLQGADFGFDQEFPSANWLDASKLRLRRLTQILAFHDLDHAIAPTKWQASTAPQEFADRISVIHEGIDTDLNCPNSNARIKLANSGISFSKSDDVVTFVARNLEPYRGFHIFMRMLPRLQSLCPGCHVLIVGGDEVSYGKPPNTGGSWRQNLLSELDGKIDLSRIHFVGKITHSMLRKVFQVSSCHIYLTYPFVLSWSMLEAMSCGTLVVGSDTAPVQEVIRHGANGMLVDFFDCDLLAGQVSEVLRDKKSYESLARAGRSTICELYDLHRICLPRQLALVKQLVSVTSEI